MAKYKFEDIAVNVTEKKKPVEEDKYTYLGLEHLDSCNFTVSRFGSDVAPKGEKLRMKKGDVLFGKRRAYQKKVAIAPFDGIFSAHGMVLRPKIEVVNKKFFPFFIASDYFLDTAIQISVGSLSPTVNWGTLKNVEFNLPDINEQEKLAEILWAANDTKEAYNKLLSLTDDLLKSQFIEMFGDPVTNSMGWPIKTLKQICTKLTDGTHFSPESYEKGDYKYVTAKNIKTTGFDFSNITYVDEDTHRGIYSRCNPENGDVLYIKDGATTGIAMVNTLNEEFSLLSSVALLKQDHSIVNGYYLCNALNNPHMYSNIRANMGGAAITRLTITKLNAIEIPIPPIDLQNQFADFVHQVDKSKFILLQTIENIENTVKSLIKQYIG